MRTNQRTDFFNHPALSKLPALTGPVRYLVAVGLTGIALAVRFLIAPQQAGMVFVTFFPAATLAAIFGGVGPGLVSTAIGAMLGIFFFVPPFNSIHASSGGIFATIIFCIDEIIVCSAIELMRRYHRQVIETAVALQKSSTIAVKAQRAAEQASLAKSRYLAATSHDLRQPYQALRLYHAVMQNKTNDPAAIVDLLQRMDAAMSAGETLLQSLLDLSTLDAGVIQPKPMNVNAFDMLSTIGMRHRPIAEAKGLKFDIKAHKGSLYVDPILIGRILDNLISNAIRYTESGSVCLAFRLCAGRPTLLVKDTGIGIAPEYQESVFEEFYQINNPARQRCQGVGLGLSVAKKTAMLMEFNLTMKSKLGKGTLFAISMTRNTIRPQATPPPGSPATP